MGVVPAGQQTVNVRSGSSTNNAVVATLTVGDAVTILGDTGEGGWLQVQLKDGTKGWVKAGLLVTSVKRNADWKPITRSFDGVEMVLVPPGCFLMGSSDGNTNERPMNLQCFNKPFWIDKTEVTNGQFTQFKGQAANKGQWSQPNRPRETITWFEARDFCAKRGSRLPTEREWEFAARGPNNLKFPWGDDFSYDNAVWAFNSNEQTMAVGSRPKGASWVGALDMSGNVWEWINTIYDQRRFPYPYESDDGRESFTGTSSERTGDAW
jgi:formylglycine-generating enzyme required for sulfatase activity